MHAYTPLTALTVLTTVHALVLNDNVGKLPALGWNAWNAFDCNIDETKIMTAANQIVSLGLKTAGYQYVNIDDCWSVKSGRDNVTGQIVPDTSKFPTGIKGTADKIHSLGLKIGIYSSAGGKTCAGYPASLSHETLDAETFAAWGVDYLKYDNCGVPSYDKDEYSACVPEGSGTYVNGSCGTSSVPAGYQWNTSTTASRYRAMRDALLVQNRTILYSLCEWGQAGVDTWGNETGSSWRMSQDINPSWSRIAEILNENSFQLNSVNFWGHNDADMLEIGNGAITLAESRSHFAFWAAMKSPLLIGTALDKLASDHVDILKNSVLLAFSQDKVFGSPANPYKWGTNPNWTFNKTNPAEYWSGASTNGTLVMALNTLSASAQRNIYWSEVPHLKNKGNAFQVTEAWGGTNLGCVKDGINATVASHDTAVYLVGRKCRPTKSMMA